MLIILAFIGTTMYVVCFTLEHQVKLLRALSIDLTIAGNIDYNYLKIEAIETRN